MSNNVIEAHENSQPEKNEKNEYKIPQYEFTRTLGSGTFGKVMAAIHIPSQENVAIKIIDKETLKDEDDLKRVEREVEIMKIIRHPNIIQFYEMIETEKQIFLVIEYAESGQLFKLMSEEIKLNERASGRIFIQLLNAVQYLHRLGIVHRDLKPENILLDVDYNVKLTDFGLSNFSEKGEFLHTACGSPCYAPPEMVAGNKYEGQKGDIWSLGIIFYGMVCGALPFEENTAKELYKKVIQGLYFIPSDISLEATEVIRKMLVTNPKDRITIPELRKLKFFVNLKNIEPKIIGLIIGFHPTPIDNEILQKMKEIINFDRTKVEDEIKQNQHTMFTTLYYLIQKQSLKNKNKTVVDLQYFLQSNQRYKFDYGILPEQCSDQLSNYGKNNENSAKTIKALRNEKEKCKYSINNTKGLSKEKRQPIKLKQKNNTQPHQIYRSEKEKSYQKGYLTDKIMRTEHKYKVKKLQKLEKSLQTKNQLKTSISAERPNRLKRTITSDNSKQKSNRIRSTHNSAGSSNSKKSQQKEKDRSKQAVWHTYFEKPLQLMKHHSSKMNSVGGSKLKNKQKQDDRTFTMNLQKLKEGFLKLPQMKKKNLSQKDTYAQKELVASPPMVSK